MVVTAARGARSAAIKHGITTDINKEIKLWVVIYLVGAPGSHDSARWIISTTQRGEYPCPIYIFVTMFINKH
jgi:hypothetical protein